MTAPSPAAPGGPLSARPLSAHPVGVRPPPGVVTGAPNLILRAEGLALLAAAVAAYAQAGAPWWPFVVFLLAPDLLMAGYLWGPRAGAAVYNLGHTTLGPLALLALGHGLAAPGLWAAGLVWAAHIGLDRALGYGLKHARGFKATHLGDGGAPGAARA